MQLFIVQRRPCRAVETNRTTEQPSLPNKNRGVSTFVAVLTERQRQELLFANYAKLTNN